MVLGGYVASSSPIDVDVTTPIVDVDVTSLSPIVDLFRIHWLLLLILCGCD